MAILVVKDRSPKEIIPNEIQNVLDEYEGVMLDNLPKILLLRRGIDHEIELFLRVRPPAKNVYRMVLPELMELQKQLDELLNARFIRSVKAPYGALVLLQKKKDESLHLCFDYRALNKLMVNNKYPLPIIIDLFDHLHEAKYFWKLDLGLPSLYCQGERIKDHMRYEIWGF